jgi:hypothetical protein
MQDTGRRYRMSRRFERNEVFGNSGLDFEKSRRRAFNPLATNGAAAMRRDRASARAA